MVTSSYEWSILKWDEKPQSNNQTNKPGFAHLYFLYFHIKMILCTFSASILYQYMYIGVCWKDKNGPFVRLTLLSTITTTDGSGQLFTRILFFSSKLHFLINLKWTNAYAYKTNMIQVVDWLWIEEKHQNNQINTQQGKKSGTFLTVNGASENLD